MSGHQSNSSEQVQVPYSQLPWISEVIGQNDCKNNVCNVRAFNGRAVAEYLAEEDAAYIVRACNDRDGLLELLGRIEKDMAAGVVTGSAGSLVVAIEIRTAIQRATT